jgi:hypothetical protein
MADSKDQCVGCIKSSSKPARNAVEIFQMLKISYWSAESRNNVIFEWFSELRSCVTSVENVDQVK